MNLWLVTLDSFQPIYEVVPKDWMKNLNYPWNGVLRLGTKQFEPVANADWVCDAVHDFLFIIDSICKEVLRYVARSVCEFDGRWIYPDLVPYTNIDMNIHIDIHIHIHIRIRIRIHIHISVYVYACVYVCVCVYIYKYKYIYIYIYP